MENKHIYNVAGYVRLSKEDGDKSESDSIINQIRLITDFLKGKDDLFLYNSYVDDGFSGTNFHRPAFQRMIADIEAGMVNCVIVKDLSRFGRDYIDTGKYLERYFPEKNVRFISIMDSVDSDRQEYDMLMPIKNIFNEQYARDISMKIHAAVRTKQKAGDFIGAFASYGYRKSAEDKNKLVIDEYAAEVVKKIFLMYVKGYGKRKIAGLLNEEGIACPSEYKRLNGDNYRNSNCFENTSYWTYSTVSRILQNEIYIGNMVQGRKYQQMRSRAKTQKREDWIVVQGTHEAIIDMKTWEKTQDLLKCRTREPNFKTDVGVFAGFIKCGDCGRALVKKQRTCTDGIKKTKYYCGGYVHSGKKFCTPHAISHNVLEQIVLEDLRMVIRSVCELKKLVEEQGNRKCTTDTNIFKSEKLKLCQELEKIRQLKKTVYEDYRDKVITKEECISYREEYAKKEELLTKKLEELYKKIDMKSPENLFEIPWIRHLVELQDVERLDREIVVEMLHEISVYDDHRIVIVYNFSDELDSLFASTYGWKGDK